MTKQIFIKELFDDLSGYDKLILNTLYGFVVHDNYREYILNRFTFEKKENLILISDDVLYDELGSIEINKDEFLKHLSRLIEVK